MFTSSCLASYIVSTLKMFPTNFLQVMVLFKNREAIFVDREAVLSPFSKHSYTNFVQWYGAINMKQNLFFSGGSETCGNEKDESSCRSWASQGHCSISPELMRSYCRKECRFCATTGAHPDGGHRETPEPEMDMASTGWYRALINMIDYTLLIQRYHSYY